MKLSELATLTAATVDAKFADLEISGAAGLDDARTGDVSFLANPRYTPKVNSTQASAIYVADGAPIERDIAILRSSNPYLAYTRALRLFHPEPDFVPFVHESAVIDPSAKVANDVWIGAGVVIGARTTIHAGARIYPNVTIYEDVEIGPGSVIHSGAAIRERSQIGARCIIHNNVVVGCDGFGYAKDEEWSSKTTSKLVPALRSIGRRLANRESVAAARSTIWFKLDTRARSVKTLCFVHRLDSPGVHTLAAA
jgi:UDP-3-O-[3-hydroxymyristoyl] glucosamine N-acyltransferase